MKPSHSIQKVAFLGTHLPRQCGIATFTSDLAQALTASFPDLQFSVVAVNDREEGYDYPDTVEFEISEKELDSYRRAADYLNVGHVDLLCLQHEYGIFGGRAGRNVLHLLRELRMPVVTTLHTVLHDPDEPQRKVLDEVLQLSERVVVLNQKSASLLQEVHHVDPEKIDVIAHGIPIAETTDKLTAKETVGLSGKKVLLTFGLLSPSKGIEFVIQALPQIVQANPDVVYAIVGVTHPHVKAHEGEHYRLGLQRLAGRLGVSGHVIFHDRFVSTKELTTFIAAADIYVTPYLNESQVSSGTLVYAFGTGTPVISTPYWCAKELLAEGRGVLVPFRDSEAIAEAAVRLFKNDQAREAMSAAGRTAGQEFAWPKVASRYKDTFSRAHQDHISHLSRVFTLMSVQDRPIDLPAVRLSHLRHLTDDTGLLQHAVFDIPNYDEGYAVDDNARALILTTLLESMRMADASGGRRLSSRYLAFVWHAYNGLATRFRNFLSYERRWCEKVGSEDSHGRTLWALGTVIHRTEHPSHAEVSKKLFDLALPVTTGFTSPRAWSFTLFGIDEYLQRFSGDSAVRSLREELVGKLMAVYETCSDKEWRWFESVISYDNAVIPNALIVSGQWMGDERVAMVGIEALEWLCKLQVSETGNFAPIGTNGHYVRGGTRARFDQQPIEAYSTVSATLAAHRLTGDQKWLVEAHRAFDWFLGLNDVGRPLYDPTTGGCRDGLNPLGVNQNMGAESTLAFLLALVEMLRFYETTRPGGATPASKASVQ